MSLASGLGTLKAALGGGRRPDHKPTPPSAPPALSRSGARSGRDGYSTKAGAVPSGVTGTSLLPTQARGLRQPSGRPPAGFQDTDTRSL